MRDEIKNDSLINGLSECKKAHIPAREMWADPAQGAGDLKLAYACCTCPPEGSPFTLCNRLAWPFSSAGAESPLVKV
jgi:hypothetical protein